MDRNRGTGQYTGVVITVRLFAGLREAMGQDRLEHPLPAGATVGTIIDRIAAHRPDLAPLLARTVAAVNLEYVPREHPLQDGDEVALIPPVSGGSGLPPVLVTHVVLDARAASDLVRRPGHGAVLVFEGVVRDHAGGRPTSFLEYEAYPELAVRQMERVREEARSRFGLDAIVIWHRLGRLEIGETSLVVAVGSPHRAEGLEAGRWIVDRVKQVVPVWKKETGPDGSWWVEGSMVPVEEPGAPGP